MLRQIAHAGRHCWLASSAHNRTGRLASNGYGTHGQTSCPWRLQDCRGLKPTATIVTSRSDEAEADRQGKGDRSLKDESEFHYVTGGPSI